MFDGAVEGTGRKLEAFFETAAKVPGFVQGTYEYGEKGLTSHSVLFGRVWTVQITNSGLHSMVFAPIRGVKPQSKSFESFLHATLHWCRRCACC